MNSSSFLFVLFRQIVSLYYVRVSQTSKAIQTTAIGTVAKSLPQNEVILLTLLVSNRYIPYTDLRKYFGWQMISATFLGDNGKINGGDGLARHGERVATMKGTYWVAQQNNLFSQAKQVE